VEVVARPGCGFAESEAGVRRKYDPKFRNVKGIPAVQFLDDARGYFGVSFLLAGESPATTWPWVDGRGQECPLQVLRIGCGRLNECNRDITPTTANMVL